ncbi:MAG: hypothetical protein SGJ27_11050 [Candidatus Melainabacteria bacterium]|nr:hypothetical protein [Candidatus Melainabacteria bacterium]
MSSSVDVIWSPREYPLAPQAVASCSAALARALTAKLLKKEESELRKLLCVAGKEVLLVIGEESDLPWLDGVVYIGQERNSTIYIPTIWQASAPLPLLERALLAANPSLMPPIAVLPFSSLIVSLAKPFIPDRQTLQSIMEKF